MSRLPADYHTHNYLCRHAVGTLTEYAAAAEQIGVAEIGFSDHAPMAENDYDDWRMELSQLEIYKQMLAQAKADHPRLTIRAGLEVDYIQGHEPWIKKLASLYNWDYLIGSVHYLEDRGWDIDNPEKRHLWLKNAPNTVWKRYFEILTQAADSGLFNIIGHCDLPKKFGNRPTCSNEEIISWIRPFLKAAARTQTAIEINTSGWEKDCREQYPSHPILKTAFEENVPLTFGSDSHAPGEVGRHFSKAVELAKSVGYTQTARFCQRKLTFHPLP